MKNTKLHAKKKKIRVKTKKVVRVLAMGTFDLVHPGHLFYLEHAKKCGNELNVIVSRDETVMRIKKHFPLFDEKSRLRMISALKVVDRAILGGKKNMLDKVEEINPDIIVLGHDPALTKEQLQEKINQRGLHAKVVQAPAFHANEFKSSLLKKKLRESTNH